MFCSQCGNAINLGDKFCVKCGTIASTPSIHSTSAATITPQMPNFGNPYAKWWAEASAVTPFPEPYEWLAQRSTLLVFDNHLAVVPDSEKRSDVADLTTAFALVGGVFGAARAIKDKISNKFTNIGSEQALDQFDAGKFVWCKKTDAEIWEVQEKRFLGMKGPSLYVLSCSFNSLLSGTLRFLFPLNSTQESFKNPIDNIGCKFIIKAEGLTEDEALIAYNNLYKDL